MAKPENLESCSSTKVFKRIRDKKDDRISSLPDELLVVILSSLPLKEAVATSVLSSRFRYLWTFIAKLDFDGTSSMVKFIGDRGSGYCHPRLDKMRLDYVDSVNSVIALHNSPEIEEFRVFFDLDKSYQNKIDEWVRFALTKKVERLELNLTMEASFGRFYDKDYIFDPCNLYSYSIDHLKYLKKIFLHHVSVSGEDLTFFLCNCPLLEHLSVTNSHGLSTLKIIGPYPSFKRLEIEFCNFLRSVEIRDVNLVYLKYVGLRVDFVVENLPPLVEIYIGIVNWNVGDMFLLPFSNYIAQLEILTLDSVIDPYYSLTSEFDSSLQMSNLKQLTVKVWEVDDGDSLIPLTGLLQASPCLQKFVFQVAEHEVEEKTRNVKPLYMSERSYPRLKEIQFVGYEGMASELELLTHIMDNAAALETLVVDMRKPVRCWEYLRRIYYATQVDEIEVQARSRAKKELLLKVPSKINLKIL